MKLIGPQANVTFGQEIGDERALNPALRRHFAKAWYLQIPCGQRPLEFFVLPDGCAELVWANGMFRVLWPACTSYVEIVPPGSQVVGFRFNLGAAPAWLGVRAGELAAGGTPLEAVNEQLAFELSAAIGNAGDIRCVLDRLEAALAEVSLRRPSVDECVPVLAHLLETAHFAPGCLLRDLQQCTNLSERSVRRETERIIGFGPKRLERVVRLQRFLGLKWNRDYDDLASLAAVAGYADQSHLTREARALTGMTPKKLASLCFEIPSLSGAFGQMSIRPKTCAAGANRA